MIRRPAHRSGWQRGLATLTVVMVLFFAMAMVAAYTNRNLIFEQRTSANSFRATQALAAAEAGVDWTIAMLNGGRINATCAAAPDDSDFRTRYLSLAFDGSLTTALWPGGLTPTPSCVMTETGTNCSCPNSLPVTLVPPAEDVEAPVVFRAEIRKAPANYLPTAYPGVVALEVRGCTSAVSGQQSGATFNGPTACHVSGTPAVVDGQSNIQVALGLVSALPVAPAATLTVGGTITLDPGTTLRASNTDPLTGLVLHSGGAVLKDLTATALLSGPSGSSGNPELAGDADLGAFPGDASGFFQATFGMLPADYREQPAAVRLNCAGACTGADLAAAHASNPTRVIWINGNLDVDSATPLGSAPLPAMIVVNGNVVFSQPVTINGVIYSSGNITWQAGANGGAVIGALIAHGNFVASGNATLAYDSEIVRRIRQSYGSFVRVPGSWRMKSS